MANFRLRLAYIFQKYMPGAISRLILVDLPIISHEFGIVDPPTKIGHVFYNNIFLVKD